MLAALGGFEGFHLVREQALDTAGRERVLDVGMKVPGRRSEVRFPARDLAPKDDLLGGEQLLPGHDCHEADGSLEAR